MRNLTNVLSDKSPLVATGLPTLGTASDSNGNKRPYGLVLHFTCKPSVSFYQTTWRSIPEDSRPHTHSRKELKSHLVTVIMNCETYLVLGSWREMCHVPLFHKV
jgi:hypothetical protein